MTKEYDLSCNIAKTLDLIGDRWTLLVIRDLLNGLTKFNDIKASLKGISGNILSDRIQHLEKNGIITSKLYTTHPPRYEYELTPKGLSLKSIVRSIIIWGDAHLDHSYGEMVHKKCGTPIEITYYCPKCHETTEDLTFISK